MRLRTIIAALLLGIVFSIGAAAQNASSVISAASTAMGANNLNSVTYSGTARNGAFGQSKSIGDPLGPVNVTQITAYTRTINLAPPTDPAALVSRATGPTQPPVVPGAPPPMPGTFNQNITGQQASTNFGQALNILTTPWGFLKGAAAAGNATVRQQGGQQLVSFSPANLRSPSGQPYTVTAYISPQNLITKVETRVEHAVVGDLIVEFEYSNYQNMSDLQVPTRIVQKQAGLTTFDAAIRAASANPTNLTELLTPPPPAAGGRGGAAAGVAPAGAAPAAGAPGAGRGGAAAPPAGGPPAAGRGGAPPAGGPGGAQAATAAPPVEKLGEGAFKIGGNYASLAIDMGDPRRGERSERRSRYGGDGRSQAGHTEQTDPLRGELPSALRPRERPRCGSRRRSHDPDPPQ